MTRVMVVDDSTTMRRMVAVMLGHAGIESVEVADARTVLRTVCDAGVDLVLCDLFMPDMDGLELIRGLRLGAPDVKIVAMSGGGFRGKLDVMTMARRLGAAEVVEKPFTQRTLVEAINRALRPPAGDDGPPVYDGTCEFPATG